MKLGATNTFPRGKIDLSDEGALNLAIAERDGCVIIDFGIPVKWVGLPKDVALRFAEAVKTHALHLPNSV